MKLAILIALAPAIALLVYIYQKDRYDREPPWLLFKIFFFGALASVPIYFIERILSSFNIFPGILSVLYTAFIVAGLTEEYFKRFVVVKLACMDKSYNEKLDGIIYCAFSALGFATVENIMYLIRGFSNFVYTGITRGIFAVPAHMLFGITMGYYLSLSKFAADKNAGRLNFRKSLLVPIILHGTYDFILMSRYTYLLFVFIIFVIYLWRINLIRLNEYIRDSKLENDKS
ncbi:MAG: PrsW family glutamic-type intramembrane protease [Clostridiales bacterium]|nr:PrsW family glutamic-type intramembrane protease [Clostridiales bacterium]